MLLPGGAAGRAELVHSVATVGETTAVAASGGQTTELAVLHDGVDDPVDAGVAADGGVGGIHQDDLVVLVDTVLSI